LFIVIDISINSSIAIVIFIAAFVFHKSFYYSYQQIWKICGDYWCEYAST